VLSLNLNPSVAVPADQLDALSGIDSETTRSDKNRKKIGTAPILSQEDEEEM